MNPTPQQRAQGRIYPAASMERRRGSKWPAGSFMLHPAGGAHYNGAKDGEVVVQISGVGPVSTEYIEQMEGARPRAPSKE